MTPTSNVTDVRAAFEKWAKPKGYALHIRDMKESTRLGEYGYADTQLLWSAWQAALSSSMPGWRPIGEAPEGVTVLVGWYEDGEERNTFDRLDEGFWIEHEEFLEHFHAVAPDGSRGPSSAAPYTHFMQIMPLPPLPEATCQRAR